jgi:hypothetical protein
MQLKDSKKKEIIKPMVDIFMKDYLSGKKNLAAKVFTNKKEIKPKFQDAFDNKGGKDEFASMEELT